MFHYVFIIYFTKSIVVHSIYNFPRPTKTRLTDKNGHGYETFYFTQQVDHFGFVNSDTYQQRYLVSKQYWNSNGGPIFFYTGNEGDIELFCNNTGFMWDIAPEFKAMLVFAEHRYYGKSVPYGQDAFKDPHKLNYLTSEQALADYAVLLSRLKSNIKGAANSPVIAFGGSYGGMLAAWFRMKYPDVVIGSLAASAPVWQFTGMTKCGDFLHVVTRTFNHTSPNCALNIAKSWSVIDSIGDTGSGKTFLTDTFQLCSPIKTSDDVDELKAWLQDTYVDLAMVDYPYPSNFLAPLPGWPVKEACNGLSDGILTDKDLIKGIYKVANLYYNYTGYTKCLDVGKEATPNLGDLGWSYQACTEMVMPMCSNGKTDMFQPSPWNFEEYSKACYQRWKVYPRKNWIRQQYLGKNLKSTSNIIFSNGYLDPWSSGGVLDSQSASLISIFISSGAHHLDLRSSNIGDPPDVRSARQQEKNIIIKWLGMDRF